MRLLLDTHFAIWLTVDPGELRDEEQAAIDAADVAIVSAVSLWEVRLKWQATYVSGARKGVVSPDDVLASVTRLGLPVLPLQGHHAAARLGSVPNHLARAFAG